MGENVKRFVLSVFFWLEFAKLAMHLRQKRRSNNYFTIPVSNRFIAYFDIVITEFYVF